MQQQQHHSFHTQQHQRFQPLPQSLPSNQQQFSSHMMQQTTNNPNQSLPTQNSSNVNPLSNTANVTQQSSINPWLALCAAALNSQAPATSTTQQPQQDTNSLTQQWAQWLKSAQMVGIKLTTNLDLFHFDKF